jgi:hypothetical protein
MEHGERHGCTETYNVIRMDPEIGGDLLEGHPVVAFAGHPNDIVTELAGIGLGHVNILPAGPEDQPRQMSPNRAADPCQGNALIEMNPIGARLRWGLAR